MIDSIARERSLLVERLRDLPPADWDRPSLCAGWTVTHVVAHLVTPFLVSVPSMALTVLRTRSVSRAMDLHARRLAQQQPAALLDVLQANAGSAFRPPGMPLSTPLTDVVAHGADIRWVLDDDRSDWAEPDRLVPVLDFLVSPRARGAFVPAGRLRGLRLVADDLPWQHGEGDEVRGPALALVMAVLGRPAAQPLLTGAGAGLAGR